MMTECFFACSAASGIDLALLDPEGRERAAAVNNTYPGCMACDRRGLLQLDQKTPRIEFRHS